MCLPDWVASALILRRPATITAPPERPNLQAFIHRLPKETINR